MYIQDPQVLTLLPFRLAFSFAWPLLWLLSDVAWPPLIAHCPILYRLSVAWLPAELSLALAAPVDRALIDFAFLPPKTKPTS